MATNLEKAGFDETDTDVAVNSRINTSDMAVWRVAITGLY
jgi:hypothetical protein